jgi:2-haloacid dehalogenase
MSANQLAGIKACVFDAYGTLFNYASAAAQGRGDTSIDLEKLTTVWREKQLQYTWLRALEGRHADFWTVTADALDFALDMLGLDNPVLRDRLMAAYLSLEPFPEVRETLRSMKQAGYRTAILSNGTPEMLQRAVENAKIGPLLDAILSVEEVGIYKPHPKVYQLAVDRLEVPRESIVFLSSNAWDAYAASAFGVRVVWCNRYGQKPERLPGRPDRVIQSLKELPGLLGAPSAS